MDLVYQERGVRIGRVFERAFATIRHHPLASLIVALLFTGLPGTAVDYLLYFLLPWQYMVLTIGPIPLPGVFAAMIAMWFVSLFFGAVAQGAMTRPVIAESEGRKARLGEVLGAALRALPSLLLLGALIGVGVVIGASLLIVPGVMTYLLWAVAPAAAAAERDGVFLALGRSQELSEGGRWKVLGVLLLLFVMSAVLALLLSFLLRFAVQDGLLDSTTSTVALIIRGLVGAVVNIVWGATQASLYVELTAWKEGSSVETLERVFV
jgi:hypothetical protein